MNQLRVLIIDNYDSFTLNLMHLIESIGAEAIVLRNNELKEGEWEEFTHLIIGPGPGVPREISVIQSFLNDWGSKPILGVCLGFQYLLWRDGQNLENLKTVRHGATAKISLTADSLIYKGIKDPMNTGLYHSWGFRLINSKSEYIQTSSDENGLVMSVQHKTKPWFGVQYHLESVMCNFGEQMMINFLSIK